MTRLYILIPLLYTLSITNSYSQNDTRKKRITAISINPVRAMFDEITVNVESGRNKPVIFGGSLGLIHPVNNIGEKFAFDQYLLNPAVSVKLRSKGYYTGLYIKFKDRKSTASDAYFSFAVNNRLTYAKNVDYAINMSGTGTYDKAYVNQRCNSTGFQFIYAKHFDKKIITHEIYFGIGAKLNYVDTKYVDFFPASEYNLSHYHDDKEFFLKATLHIGYRIGLKLGK